jgi:two-component system chemotaxis response regulator CheY
MMPGLDGTELCRRIRATEKSRYVYFILLTARSGKEDIIQGLEAGADDYLVKPFNPAELKWRVNIGKRILELQSRILEMAMTDALTGVLNRKAFLERAEMEMQRAKRVGTPLSLIMADIDHFKSVNDRNGHQAGDLVLKEFVKVLTRCVRGYDFVGRYGGEEFLVGLPETGLPMAEAVAKRLRSGIEQTSIALPGREERVHITSSFGLAAFQLDQDDSLEEIIKRADEALYRAKNSGRNRVCVEIRKEK